MHAADRMELSATTEVHPLLVHDTETPDIAQP